MSLTVKQLHAIHRRRSLVPVPPIAHPISTEARNTLIQELTTTRYVSDETIRTYMASVTSVTSWKTPYFQMDLWISDAQRSKWDDVMNALLRRLESLRIYHASSKSIHFVCVPLDIPRRFPNHTNQCLGREHVNGGYTYVNGDTVYLFRREELPKVMLHEYLHQLQGHKDAEWTSEALENVRALVSIPSSIDIRPNEAVVEVWALFYHTHFLAVETGIPFKTLWDAETRFVLQQARHIWTHQSHCLPRWNEETHTFSYYILKAWFVWAWSDATAHVWRLDYSVDELTQWIQSHWAEWKKKIETVRGTGMGTGTAPALREPKSARMTLLGDF